LDLVIRCLYIVVAHKRFQYSDSRRRPDIPGQPKIHVRGLPSLQTFLWGPCVISAKLARHAIHRAVQVRSARSETVRSSSGFRPWKLPRRGRIVEAGSKPTSVKCGVWATRAKNVIDGFCVSACTIVLSTIPHDRICVTSRAELERHCSGKTRGMHRSPFCDAQMGPQSCASYSRTDPLLLAAFQHTRGLSPTSQLSSPQGAVTNAPTRGAKWQERSSI
jgi:hypothetical protein